MDALLIVGFLGFLDALVPISSGVRVEVLRCLFNREAILPVGLMQFN
jgi:hypothetical protein